MGDGQELQRSEERSSERQSQSNGGEAQRGQRQSDAGSSGDKGVKGGDAGHGGGHGRHDRPALAEPQLGGDKATGRATASGTDKVAGVSVGGEGGLAGTAEKVFAGVVQDIKDTAAGVADGVKKAIADGAFGGAQGADDAKQKAADAKEKSDAKEKQPAPATGLGDMVGKGPLGEAGKQIVNEAVQDARQAIAETKQELQQAEQKLEQALTQAEAKASENETYAGAKEAVTELGQAVEEAKQWAKGVDEQASAEVEGYATAKAMAERAWGPESERDPSGGLVKQIEELGSDLSDVGDMLVGLPEARDAAMDRSADKLDKVYESIHPSNIEGGRVFVEQLSEGKTIGEAAKAAMEEGAKHMAGADALKHFQSASEAHQVGDDRTARIEAAAGVQSLGYEIIQALMMAEGAAGLIEGGMGLGRGARMAEAEGGLKAGEKVDPLGKTQADPLGKTQADPLGKTQVDPLGKTQADPLGKTELDPKAPVDPLGKTQVDPLGQTQPGGGAEGPKTLQGLGPEGPKTLQGLGPEPQPGKSPMADSVRPEPQPEKSPLADSVRAPETAGGKGETPAPREMSDKELYGVINRIQELRDSGQSHFPNKEPTPEFSKLHERLNEHIEAKTARLEGGGGRGAGEAAGPEAGGNKGGWVEVVRPEELGPGPRGEQAPSAPEIPPQGDRHQPQSPPVHGGKSDGGPAGGTSHEFGAGAIGLGAGGERPGGHDEGGDPSLPGREPGGEVAPPRPQSGDDIDPGFSPPPGSDPGPDIDPGFSPRWESDPGSGGGHDRPRSPEAGPSRGEDIPRSREAGPSHPEGVPHGSHESGQSERVPGHSEDDIPGEREAEPPAGDKHTGPNGRDRPSLR